MSLDLDLDQDQDQDSEQLSELIVKVDFFFFSKSSPLLGSFAYMQT